VDDKSIGASIVNIPLVTEPFKIHQTLVIPFNTDVAKMVYIQQLAINSYGCRDSIIKQVEIKPAYTFTFLMLLLLNSDGTNDSFRAVGVGIEEFKMQIFDRWGLWFLKVMT